MIKLDIPQKDLNKLKLLVLDSDGITVPTGGTVIEKESKDKLIVNINLWLISKETTDKIKLLKEKGIDVCISSGRSLMSLQGMYAPVIGKGTILMAENGNLLFKDGVIYQAKIYSDRFLKKLYTLREVIKNMEGITGIEPKQFIITARANFESKDVYQLIKEIDRENELYSIWVGEEVHEVGHKNVSKGNTLKKLIKTLGLKKENVMTIGDSTNDIDMVKAGGMQISANIKVIKAKYCIDKKTALPKQPADILLDYLLKNL